MKFAQKKKFAYKQEVRFQIRRPAQKKSSLTNKEVRLQIKRGCPKSNERYTKCGGFDKLNHRNANLLDSPPMVCTALEKCRYETDLSFHGASHGNDIVV